MSITKDFNKIPREKIQRQIELEKESVELGVKFYKDKVMNEPLSDLPPGLALVRSAIEPLHAAIEQFKAPSTGGARLQHTRRFLKDVDSYEIAFLTARHLVDVLPRRLSLQNVAVSLAKIIKEHIEYLKMKEEAPGWLHRVEQRLRTTHRGHRRGVLKHARRKINIPDEPWDKDILLSIGIKLIEMFIETTGLVEKVQDTRSRWIVQGTPEAVKWLTDQHARCELLAPFHLPMIVPPTPWTTPLDGGFLLNGETRHDKMVKVPHMGILRTLADVEMPLVYRALNALQDTPWRINTKVLEVMEAAWDLDNELGNLPMRDREEPLPPKPWDTDEEFEYLKENEPDVIKNWNRQATFVYDRRAANVSKRTNISRTLFVADKFRDEEEIYFVWTLDWRGRAYPMQSWVNPQADDFGKSLLQFAEGKPLGKDGAFWLAIQLANTYGYDKVSLEERVAWVHEHEDLILDSAENPLDGEKFWDTADEPWQFLAACFEWQGYRSEGDSYVSHIPIAMDGTCNGLQNFSAMLRDEIGGHAVNLVPMERPQDVYHEVAEVVSQMVAEDAANGVEYADIWVGKVDRQLTKRNVMTVPYGVTSYGIREQLLEEVKDRGPGYLDIADPYPAVSYLAGRMYEAIGEVVVAARLAMDWLQDVARIVTSEGLSLKWTVPSGFVVSQEYREQKSKRIETAFGGMRLRLSLQQDTEKLHAKKQRAGISPNFVHSMDASHLMLTINKAVDEGLTAFAMVHDSYGTLAADTSRLARILREAFIEQYSEDVLENFRKEIASQLPKEVAETLPPVPPKGNLDIEAVRDSRYFFA